ncbi:MAG: peroxiredoxin [bacterium]
MGKELKVGDKAPDWTLQDKTGKDISLKDFVGKKIVVLYFYPKDYSPGCTAEACSFRDAYEVFKQKGAEVIGISDDDGKSHEGFATQHKLPFILLSDPSGKTADSYGIGKMFFILRDRVTFVIDAQGIIRHIFNNQFEATKHISEALKAIEELKL